MRVVGKHQRIGKNSPFPKRSRTGVNRVRFPRCFSTRFHIDTIGPGLDGKTNNPVVVERLPEEMLGMDVGFGYTFRGGPGLGRSRPGSKREIGMDAPIFVYENFIHQVIPETCLHRLSHYREHLLAWSRASKKPLWWTLDPGRDTFIIEAPGISKDEMADHPVPVFLLGRRDDHFSVEFYDFVERHKVFRNRYLFNYRYRDGLLRLPEHLRADTEHVVSLVCDAVRAHCETRLMRHDAEDGRDVPSLLEAISVDIADTKYHAVGNL